ncbi:MAG: hypothetical protein NTZ74_09410 [Chloroflexi bacterium]|nr:hypothetical protein [Chloroflexota bacterium]
MTEEEYREAQELQRRINNLINQINYTLQENVELEVELEVSIKNVYTLIDNCEVVDNDVYEQMGWLSGQVGDAEISTKEVFDALNELTSSYFTFKNISTASKNMTQFMDEYNTHFSYYNELRRITLGYVIGLDMHIVSSESMRKKVEKVYLQNSDYWLAYSIAAVMLWASDEKEAAVRAINKSMTINYFNTCLFFLLINLRFNRIDAARKWYVNYLDRADMNNLGDEWQYLLQAYLAGAFGAHKEFQAQIATCFKNMLAQVEVTNIDFGKKFADKALEFAQLFLHTTDQEYETLHKTCLEYQEMRQLLSNAEKNTKIAKYYNMLTETEVDESKDLPQRIENVLYSLISNYDEDELKVVKKLKYNEAIVSAKGDLSAAQAKYDAMFMDENKKKSLGDMFLHWAFDEDSSQTNIIVKRFSITFMKEWIAKGFVKFAETYRQSESQKYSIEVDGFKMTCGEDDFESVKLTLEKNYDKNKWKDFLKDKFILIYGVLCLVALIILIIMVFAFSKVALTLGIIVGLAGSFLLWRRIVDLNKILWEKKRLGVLKLKQALEDLRQWRHDYKEADAKHADLMNAIGKFEK